MKLLVLFVLALSIGFGAFACVTDASDPAISTALADDIESACRDWQLDSANSELAWEGYRAGLRPAPRAPTAEEEIWCRQNGYLSFQEHCGMWFQIGVRPPWVGSTASQQTVNRSCEPEPILGDAAGTSLPVLIPAVRTVPSPTPRPSVWTTGELCRQPGMLPPVELTVGLRNGVPYRFTLIDASSRGHFLYFLIRIDHLPDSRSPTPGQRRGEVPRFGIADIPRDLRFDDRGMSLWTPVIGYNDGIAPEHALWYPSCTRPAEVVRWDRYPTFEHGGSGLFEWTFSYPEIAANVNFEFTLFAPLRQPLFNFTIHPIDGILVSSLALGSAP